MEYVTLAVYTFRGGAPPHRGHWMTSIREERLDKITKPYEESLAQLTRIPRDQFGGWSIIEVMTDKLANATEIRDRTEIEGGDIIAVKKDMRPGYVY